LWIQHLDVKNNMADRGKHRLFFIYNSGKSEGERERDRQTDRQTERKTDRDRETE